MLRWLLLLASDAVDLRFVVGAPFAESTNT